MGHIEEEIIRKRAYALWEAEGRPDGKEGAHWDQAYQELSEEAAAGAPADEPEAAALPLADAGTMVAPAPKRKRKTA